MTYLKLIFLAAAGLGFGALTSGGVFTVFVSVRMIPRFAGKTHTADKIIHYESMLSYGTVVGCILSVFAPFLPIGISILSFFEKNGIEEYCILWKIVGSILLILFGVFSGMFIGCLSIAIAEMLNTIPIFVRRIQLGYGVGIVLLSIALGKIIGSLYYFFKGIYESIL
ncbi:MAG: stage V sporulation protein AB [Lachnospiraceae bacterium]